MWEMKPLGDVGIRVLDCEHKTPIALAEGYPYIAIPQIQDGRIDLASARRISYDDFTEWTRRTKPQAGDIVVTRRGRVGDTAPIPFGAWTAIGQNLVLLRSDTSQIDPSYLRWATRGPWWRGEVNRMLNVGAVFDSLNVSDLPSMRIPVPPIAEQRAIAATLGALDDKIESNRRTVGLLLNLATALYDKALRSGAVTCAVSDIAVFHNRRRVPLSQIERDARGGIVPYYGAAGVVSYVDEALYHEVMVLVGEDGSVVRSDGGPVLQYIWGPAWVNNHAHTLTGSGMPSEFLYLALHRADVRPLITGAVQPKLNMSNLKKFEVRIPRAEARARLEPTIGALFDQYRYLSEHTIRLAALRDALLPELLSGRLRVPADLADPATGLRPAPLLDERQGA